MWIPVYISFVLYLISFFLPATVGEFSMLGFKAFYVGFLYLLEGWPFGWLANPIYFAHFGARDYPRLPHAFRY